MIFNIIVNIGIQDLNTVESFISAYQPSMQEMIIEFQT